MYKVVKLENGKFGLQRQGSVETHGQYDTWIEACEAGGIAQAANSYRPECTSL